MNRQVKCNCCGKVLRSEQGILKEECVEIRHSFGYFSGKDTMKHRFCLCEECYDKIVAGFCIPVEEETETELFQNLIQNEETEC